MLKMQIITDHTRFPLFPGKHFKLTRQSEEVLSKQKISWSPLKSNLFNTQPSCQNRGYHIHTLVHMWHIFKNEVGKGKEQTETSSLSAFVTSLHSFLYAIRRIFFSVGSTTWKTAWLKWSEGREDEEIHETPTAWTQSSVFSEYRKL